jgi:hypothetical protein
MEGALQGRRDQAARPAGICDSQVNHLCLPSPSALTPPRGPFRSPSNRALPSRPASTRPARLRAPCEPHAYILPSCTAAPAPSAPPTIPHTWVGVWHVRSHACSPVWPVSPQGDH